MLEGDTNGDGVADFGIELTGNMTLTHGDFTAGSLCWLPARTLTGGGSGNTLTDRAATTRFERHALDGGGGADTMIGGAGNDTYVVDNAGDVVVEKGGAAFTVPAGWTIKGTADFNNDGELDVVVTNGTLNQIWLSEERRGVVDDGLPTTAARLAAAGRRRRQRRRPQGRALSAVRQPARRSISIATARPRGPAG